MNLALYPSRVRSSDLLERTNLFALINRSSQETSLRFRGAQSSRWRTESAGQDCRSEALFDRAPEINRKSHLDRGPLDQRVKVSVVAPLVCRGHPASQLRREPFDPVSRLPGIRQRAQWQVAQSASSRYDMCALTNRSSGRVQDKVPSSCVGARAAQLNR